MSGLAPVMVMIAAVAAALTVLQSCSGARHETDISFVDHVALSMVEDPMSLVIRIDAEGKLTLNKIETGTIADPALLNEKLRTILEDRRRSSIDKNEVLIEMVGTIAYEDIDALLASLKPLPASRITVVTK